MNPRLIHLFPDLSIEYSLFTCRPNEELIHWVHDDLNLKHSEFDMRSIYVSKDINDLGEPNVSRMLNSYMVNLKGSYYRISKIEFYQEDESDSVLKYLVIKENFKVKLVDSWVEDFANQITNREKEVLICIGQSMSTKNIADHLHVSKHTIASHKENICNKLGVKKNTELAIWAYRLGLVAG